MVQKTLESSIEEALKNFSQISTSESVKHLFETLGYSTQREVILDTHIPDEVVEMLGWENFREDKGLFVEWESVDCLFQVTEDEITQKSQLGLFQPSLDKDYLKSYIFMGITLQKSHYSRSKLADITREINRQSDIPIMVLFRYEEVVTLAIINRRPNQLDQDKDVLEKVTLIKDININFPHRAHLQILRDLALVSLKDVRNFDELHTKWQKVLDTSELNKNFFKEVSNWYFWATSKVTFPDGAEKDENIRNATSVIRLITRLIFVWFLKEKGLVPPALFDEKELKGLLKSLESDESTYYKAVLQNLFFATLNTEMNTETKPDHRKFRGKTTQKRGRDQHYGVANVYRYQDYFINSDQFLELCHNIPFLNGGLFECLDRDKDSNDASQSSEKGKEKGKIRIDGFSDREDNPLSVPNVLFFGEEREVDLNAIYGTKNKKYKVRGLIEIFNRYKFTINENTPIDEEIALDPELLGKVFENLLAAYNPETETTARKKTGSFYTPREIVNYMVDESLIAYLQNALVSQGIEGNNEEKLRALLTYNEQVHQFSDREVEYLINAIDQAKIIDIACGSGAFPMGILQKLVFILGKLDPNNHQWKEQQKEKAIQPVLNDIQVAKQISYEDAREEAIETLKQRLADIEQEFESNEMDYPRKLFLIENSIFGVDIQPIAVQIAKLRFFISLIVDQKVNDHQPNRGILPLPNLETKFVAANSLIGIETAQTLRTMEVIEKEEELKKVRQQHFTARTPKTKRKCREKDKALRQEISELLKSTGLETAIADTLARWNPYDLNASSDFFDPEWMFGVSAFDICIGNPPYIGQKKNNKLFRLVKQSSLGKRFHQRRMDYFYFFIHLSLDILKNNGIFAYITTNYYLTATYADRLREDIKQRSSILFLINFHELKIFESALGQHNIITIAQKPYNPESIVKTAFVNETGVASSKTLRKIFSRQNKNTIYDEIKNVKLYDKNTHYIVTTVTHISTSINDSLFEKLLSNSITLGSLYKVVEGIHTGADKLSKKHIQKFNLSMKSGRGIYVLSNEEKQALEKKLNKEEKELIKPWFKNSDIHRFVTNKEPQQYLIYYHSKRNYNNIPNIKQHLEQFKIILINRKTRSGTGLVTINDYDKFISGKLEISYVMNASAFRQGNYYCLSYPRSPEVFESAKIITPQRSLINTFAYNEGSWYASADCYFILQRRPQYSLKFLLGFLNSKLCYYWLYSKGKRKGQMLELYIRPLSEIPIKLGLEAKQESIIKLVNKILETKSQNPNADTSDLEREIDQIVYQLYGLTEEKIAIIEESVK